MPTALVNPSGLDVADLVVADLDTRIPVGAVVTADTDSCGSTGERPAGCLRRDVIYDIVLHDKSADAIVVAVGRARTREDAEVPAGVRYSESFDSDGSDGT